MSRIRTARDSMRLKINGHNPKKTELFYATKYFHNWRHSISRAGFRGCIEQFPQIGFGGKACKVRCPLTVWQNLIQFILLRFIALKKLYNFWFYLIFLQAIWVASVHSCVIKFSHHVFHLALLHAAIKDSRHLPSSLWSAQTQSQHRHHPVSLKSVQTKSSRISLKSTERQYLFLPLTLWSGHTLRQSQYPPLRQKSVQI